MGDPLASRTTIIIWCLTVALCILMPSTIFCGQSCPSTGDESIANDSCRHDLWIGLSAGIHLPNLAERTEFPQGLYSRLTLLSIPVADWNQFQLAISYAKSSLEFYGAEFYYGVSVHHDGNYNILLGTEIGLESAPSRRGLIISPGLTSKVEYYPSNHWVSYSLALTGKTGVTPLAVGGEGLNYTIIALTAGINFNLGMIKHPHTIHMAQ